MSVVYRCEHCQAVLDETASDLCEAVKDKLTKRLAALREALSLCREHQVSRLVLDLLQDEIDETSAALELYTPSASH